MATYNHEKVEQKWKEKWFKDNIYEAVDFSDKPKQYILAELPYPSGKFLHVGHMMRYTVPEIYSRFLRMKGYNVLFPMGWDSFGLPAETYALKEGVTPQEAIAQAAVDYKEAMQSMGYAIDWDREINTSDPEYYKWTQWTFLKLWERGLAEPKEMPVWWCKELGVLADEEVLPAKDGEGKVSERGGYPVERKMFKQWVLRIPDYADRLIEDLDTVDYMDSVKQGQINWIGRKEGALVNFKVAGQEFPVFTTRPDTLFGVTFLAVSPEHELVEKLLEKVQNKKEILDYIDAAKSLSDLEKQTKEKTGVRLEGVLATHPFAEDKVMTGREIPVFAADYILVDYGTGAVMGVPAHDERDHEFAEKYNLDIVEVVKPDEVEEDGSPTSSAKPFDGDGTVVNSGADYEGMRSEDFRQKIIERLEKEGKGEKSKTYKLRPQVFSRQRYWGEPIPLIYTQDGEIEPIPEKDLPLELPIMKEFWSEDGESPLANNEDWKNTIDSQGRSATRETDTMPTWAGSNWYFLRYIAPHNNKALADMEKLKYWMPVDKYFGDAGHTTAHLLYSRFWYKVLHDEGVVPTSEPYQWRMSGGILLGEDNQKMSKSRGNTINPQDVLENYGADAVRTYLAFIGPYEDTYPWNPNGLVACHRLVRTIYEMREKVRDIPTDSSTETQKLLHQLLKKLTGMLTDLKMNTAVSEIMIFVNHLKKQEEVSKETWLTFVKAIAPIMPFVAEELWQEANDYKDWKKENSVHLQSWPEFNPELVAEDTVELPVQINGKVRTKIVVASDSSESQVTEQALQNEIVKSYLNGKEPKKVVYVQGRIINLLV